MITAKQIFNELNESDRTKVMDYLRDHATSKRIFRNNFTEAFWDDLKERRDSKIIQHCLINCWGSTGSYKSGLMVEIGRFMDRNFSADKIMFTDTEFLNAIETAKQKAFFLRDEITNEYGIGSGRQSAFIIMQTETLRAFQTSMGFVSPTEKRIETAHYILHTIGHNKVELDDNGMPKDRVFVLAGVINPQTRNYIGGLTVEIEWMNKVWQQYWKKKVKFLDDVRSRHFEKLNFEELAEEVMNQPESGLARTKYDWMVLIQKTHPDLTTEEVKMLCAQIKMLQRQGEF